MLDQDIGLDLTPHVGERVSVSLYKLDEPLPEFMYPRQQWGRVVVVRSKDQIISAWLDAGRHRAFACSLSGLHFEQISGGTFEDLVAQIVDTEDVPERELAQLSPEEVAHRYSHAVNGGDSRFARALESRHHLANYLFNNMDNYTVVDMQQVTLPDTPDNVMLMQVTVDFKVSRAVVFDSGRHARLGSKNTFMPKIGRRGSL